MRFLLYIITAVLFLSSCSDQSQNSAAAVTEAVKDTVRIKPLSPQLEKLVALFKDHTEFPLIIDSAYIAAITESDTLTGSQVKLLDLLWLDHDLTKGLTYEMNSYYEIDSLETNGAFSAYTENADIGMIVSASVYAGHRVYMEDGTELLSWSLRFSSYPACPYSAGTYVFYSLLYNGEITGSFIIGESYGAGDPPVSMEIEVFSSIESDGTIRLNATEINSDMDTPERDVLKREMVISIIKGKSKITSDTVKEFKEPNPDFSETNY